LKEGIPIPKDKLFNPTSGRFFSPVKNTSVAKKKVAKKKEGGGTKG
jgi:hypothetical protein